MSRLEMRLSNDSIELIAWLMELAEQDMERREAAEKVKTWLTLKAPEFEGTSPLMLINIGKAHKVLSQILKINYDPF